ncbi:hypothetical protein [Colwellia sp. Bg11-12]|jgi:hypothetical protein|uniref:hypothetical protein n=1 Tax=Colwellia sp. Bg11-12 TaxID=2759817 RepID=UPI0015F4CD35|nr:hypothetical protein [Colwellia sp. Bg11-12]MBA6262242.1 hypothetical protein [Colwellia sp. Bg11-12]
MIMSQLGIIEQAQQYLNTVSKKNYAEIPSPNFMSSAGAHMRHIIDHYLAIISGVESKLINYDARVRGSKIESSPELAAGKLTEIAVWIKNLSQHDLSKIVTLSTEVSIANENVQKVQTTIVRELVFAGSHAVHHFAMIAQISLTQKNSLQTTELPHNFGLAPATATFLRENSERPVDAKNKETNNHQTTMPVMN